MAKLRSERRRAALQAGRKAYAPREPLFALVLG